MTTWIDQWGPSDGEAIVLLHGLSSSRNTYHEVAPHLASDGWRVLSVDLIGHGDAPRGAQYRCEDYATGVIESIQAVGVDRAVVVGHSLGGITAAAMAAIAPETTRALFLEDPPLFEGDPEVRAVSPAASIFTEVVAQIRAWHEAEATVAQIAAEFGAQPLPDGTTIADQIGQTAVELRAASLQRFDPTAMDAAISGETFSDLDPERSLSCPVTVLAADPAVGAVFRPEHGDRFVAANPHAAVITAPGQAHGIHDAVHGGADLYLSALQSFLAAL